MKNTVLFFMLFLLISQSGFSQPQKNYSEKLALADSYRLFQPEGFSFQYDFSDKDTVSSMRVYLKESDINSVLCVYLKPAKLTARKILVENNTFWMLDRNMRDPVRISARQMLFGQASAGDITRLAFSGSYDIQGGKEEKGFVILELKTRPGVNVSYPKVTLIIRSDDSRPVKAQLFTATGIHVKTIEYVQYGRIENRILLTEFQIVNELNHSISRVALSHFSTRTLNDRFFSREGMKALK